jgi:CubicO group peptidase (beta-lactamase class C family)
MLLLLNLALDGQSQPAERAYWPTHGWRTSSPEAQGMDSQVLARAFDYVRVNHIPIHSLLIVKNGYVVLDAYFFPYRKGQLHDGASMTKSVTSSLIGIAIQDRKLDGLHRPVLTLFPNRSIANRDERKEQMTVEDLLTMSSGLSCDPDHAEMTLQQMRQSADWVQFMLDQRMTSDPGDKFVYCSGGMHLLSGIISQVTGGSALELARRELFGPLGIRNEIWPADPNGVNYGWGDLHLQPQDWAKIGYLWLNQGRWEDRQILPPDWISEATEVHSHPARGDAVGYGYGFWLYPHRSPPEYEALGRGGQRITLTPAENRIVVCTGGGFEPADIGKFIGESIKSSHALPENPAAQTLLAGKVREATSPPEAESGSAGLAARCKTVSGKVYEMDANPLKLKSVSLVFARPDEGTLRLEFAGGRVETRPMGLDGIPRLSRGGLGLPVALLGRWTTDDTFEFDYDEAANIDSYRYRLTFDGNKVEVDVSEKTGLLGAVANFRGNLRAR